jgi:hypothetical protein
MVQREARREMSGITPSTKNTLYSFNGTRYKGDWDIRSYGAMKCVTNLKNHLTMNVERFMIRAVFALYPGQSRKGIRAILNGIRNDREHEHEIEFVDEKASNQSTNEVFVIRAVIQEHRAALALVNPAEKISQLKKDKERSYRLVLRYFVFLDRELERKVEMKSERDGSLS